MRSEKWEWEFQSFKKNWITSTLHCTALSKTGSSRNVWLLEQRCIAWHMQLHSNTFSCCGLSHKTLVLVLLSYGLDWRKSAWWPDTSSMISSVTVWLGHSNDSSLKSHVANWQTTCLVFFDEVVREGTVTDQDHHVVFGLFYQVAPTAGWFQVQSSPVTNTSQKMKLNWPDQCGDVFSWMTRRFLSAIAGIQWSRESLIVLAVNRCRRTGGINIGSCQSPKCSKTA